MIKLNIIKKKIKYPDVGYKNIDESYYCCSQGDYLFHNDQELRDFCDENDFFSIDEDY